MTGELGEPAGSGLEGYGVSRLRRLPPGWEAETVADDVEALLLRLPPEVTRISATMRLAIQAEFGGWELKRTRLYPDGSRKVLLRRKRTRTRPRTAGPHTELA
ncbi:DUF5703 family protein [Gordonia araii]|uniref:DUF5703 family protein n=1 Tax=Gordonia araii TaxID=263909 RepID=UPI003570BCCD